MSLSDSRYELAAISAKINLASSQSSFKKIIITIIINKRKESMEKEGADKHCSFLPLV